MIRVFTAILICSAGIAGAQTLSFPSNASLQREVVSAVDSYDLPIGIWASGDLPVQTVEMMAMSATPR